MVSGFSENGGRTRWVQLCLCVIGSIAVGQLGMWISGGWQGYSGLNVSILTPPPYVLGIAWLIMFALMGVSLYLVLQKRAYNIRTQKLKNTSLALWTAQYILITVLPLLLFASGIYSLAFVTASLASAFISALIIINLKLTAPASLLLLPCLGWLILETHLALVLALNN